MKGFKVQFKDSESETVSPVYDIHTVAVPVANRLDPRQASITSFSIISFFLVVNNAGAFLWVPVSECTPYEFIGLE